MEKERFTFRQRILYEDREELIAFDGFNLDDFMRVITNYLNQQSARIKELEKENQKANIENYLTDYYLVEKENQQLKEQLEIFKTFNDALQQDNLDLSYNKVDTAYEYAKEMAENWEKDYQEEIQQLKQSQKQLAISELEKAKNCCEKYAEELYDNLIDVVLPTDIDKPKREAMKYLYLVSEVIDSQIKKLKGEE